MTLMPNKNPYSRFIRSQLILRDELAMDRTLLANERTLLAYVRTALTLLLSGVTFVHFSKAIWFSIVGIVCLVCGAATVVIGFKRYLDMHTSLQSLRDAAVCGIAETEKKLIAELTQPSDEP